MRYDVVGEPASSLTPLLYQIVLLYHTRVCRCRDQTLFYFLLLLLSQMLNAFLEEHANDLIAGTSHNLKDFRAFNHRIPEIVRKSVQPVLVKCETVCW